MQVTTEDAPTPVGSWQQKSRQIAERRSYRVKIRYALMAIAQLRPREGDSVSALAVTLSLITEGIDRSTTREAVGDAWQLLVDLGIASPVLTKGQRVTSLFEFCEPFGPENVGGVLGWDGCERVSRDE